jgi:glycosyltransferase involved in cell wall biosynthesis
MDSAPVVDVPLGPEPAVTLVVAMRNERDHIEACLRSILDQDYPSDRIEILVFDGRSTDGSRETAERVLTGLPRAAVVENPRRIQAAAWNEGIERATGDVIGIVSGHATLGRGYVRAAVDTLRRTGATMVGGPVRAIGEGIVGEAVALAVSTPFGVGGARFRYLDEEEDVDTVFMGLCRREVYRQFPFDEEMVRNQDDELSYRILDAGGRIVCNPSIESTYRSRPTLATLWAQYFDYGYWKVRVIQKHPEQARIRHLVPATLVAGLASGAVVARLWAPAAVVPIGYLGAVAVASAVAAGRRSPTVVPVLALVYPILHLSYGLGFLTGLIRHRRWPPGSRRSVLTALAGRTRHVGWRGQPADR